jgi:hypothetical protein
VGLDDVSLLLSQQLDGAYHDIDNAGSTACLSG